MTEMTDRVKAITNAVHKAWNELKQKSYEAWVSEKLSVWVSSTTEKELVCYHQMSQRQWQPNINEIIDFNKPTKPLQLALMGMPVQASDKLSDNQIIMCRGTKDKYGIPKYDRLAVITITPKTTYDTDIQLENPW